MWIEKIIPTHPLKGSVWVECIAEIRNNKTGEIREHEIDQILEDGEIYPCVFNFEEGSFSCDCNRELFFRQSKNEENEYDWNRECGEGQFSVNLKNKHDGEIYYREFENSIID